MLYVSLKTNYIDQQTSEKLSRIFFHIFRCNTLLINMIFYKIDGLKRNWYDEVI